MWWVGENKTQQFTSMPKRKKSNECSSSGRVCAGRACMYFFPLSLSAICLSFCVLSCIIFPPIQIIYRFPLFGMTSNERACEITCLAASVYLSRLVQYVMQAVVMSQNTLLFQSTVLSCFATFFNSTISPCRVFYNHLHSFYFLYFFLFVHFIWCVGATRFKSLRSRKLIFILCCDKSSRNRFFHP